MMVPMLVQTNSYIVPREKRSEHGRLMRRFRQALVKLGCEQFEVLEQVSSNWRANKGEVRFVQIMHFRDRQHHQAVQEAERNDPAAQELIREFCDLIGLEQQRGRSLFAVGFYVATGVADGEFVEAEPPDDSSDAPPSGVESRDFTTADVRPQPPGNRLN
jgi:hypothetical protein